jgi:hypothetical protein
LPRDPDIGMMKHLVAIVIAAAVLSGVAATDAAAQVMIPPGASPLAPPPPAPPPPPKIEVPPIPQMDAPPSRQNAPLAKKSFGDRVVDCLDDAAAAGMKPSQRAAYSRACANR